METKELYCLIWANTKMQGQRIEHIDSLPNSLVYVPIEQVQLPFTVYRKYLVNFIQTSLGVWEIAGAQAED